jgi:hypothetical protein
MRLPPSLQGNRARRCEFRAARRDPLESARGVATTNGVVTISPADHNGYDAGTWFTLTAWDDTWHPVR